MAVNNGIRFEKALDLLTPIFFTEWAKQTKAADDARIERNKKEEIIVWFNGTIRKL